MILHSDSHTDHVPQVVLDYVFEKYKDRSGFFIETRELPADLPTLINPLYGPVCGDPPVAENEVFYKARSGRSNLSRMVCRPRRVTRLCTVIAGPYQGQPCVLYTVFGGPASPKEPTDRELKPEEREGSHTFWEQHALASPMLVIVEHTNVIPIDVTCITEDEEWILTAVYGPFETPAEASAAHGTLLEASGGDGRAFRIEEVQPYSHGCKHQRGRFMGTRLGGERNCGD